MLKKSKLKNIYKFWLLINIKVFWYLCFYIDMISLTGYIWCKHRIYTSLYTLLCDVIICTAVMIGWLWRLSSVFPGVYYIRSGIHLKEKNKNRLELKIKKQW